MSEDPVAREAADEDLYDVATWEVRTLLDRVATTVHRGLSGARGRVLVAFALLLFVAQLALAGVLVFQEPTLGALALVSAVPAVVFAGAIWYRDPTMREPLEPLAATFVLAILFASIAALLNSTLQPLFSALPLVGMALFFLLIVGPIEETVKWLAVRVGAFDTFDAVVDGAVYGAVAGLGFATIENAIYIIKEFSAASGGAIDVALQVAAQRAFVGPGHVIYSAFAGYYLGLAKFNPEHRGTIAVKGLLIAAGIHAFYNTVVTYVPLGGLGFVAFVVAFDGVFGYVLYRKLTRYREHYRDAVGERGATAD